MKTYKEFKLYYSNGTKDEILEEFYEDYKQLSQLQQEKEQIESDLYVSNMIIKDLLDSNEELIKWLEKKIKEINPKKLSNSELYKITSDMKMQRYYVYVNVLLKLKDSDKNEKDSSF